MWILFRCGRFGAASVGDDRSFIRCKIGLASGKLSFADPSECSDADNPDAEQPFKAFSGSQSVNPEATRINQHTPSCSSLKQRISSSLVSRIPGSPVATHNLHRARA